VGLNHREVQCIDDHEVQLDQVITAPMPKIPLDISIRSKFLCSGSTTKTIAEFFSSLACD